MVGGGGGDGGDRRGGGESRRCSCCSSACRQSPPPPPPYCRLPPTPPVLSPPPDGGGWEFRWRKGFKSHPGPFLVRLWVAAAGRSVRGGAESISAELGETDPTTTNRGGGGLPRRGHPILRPHLLGAPRLIGTDLTRGLQPRPLSSCDPQGWMAVLVQWCFFRCTPMSREGLALVWLRAQVWWHE